MRRCRQLQLHCGRSQHSHGRRELCGLACLCRCCAANFEKVTGQTLKIVFIMKDTNHQSKHGPNLLWIFWLARCGTSVHKRFGVHGASVQACLDEYDGDADLHSLPTRPIHRTFQRTVPPCTAASQVADELFLRLVVHPKLAPHHARSSISLARH